jgi:hypothetical protein
MARMFEVFAEAQFAASKVFRSWDEAERWVVAQPGASA